jgi:multidrug transporter EmrE-like cation transporter
MFVFHEPMNLFKAIGIAIIVAGVAMIGRSKQA